MEAVGSGSAKLILFGEHAAVHGFPAIGVQLPERTTVRLFGPPADAWDLESVRPQDREALRILMARLEGKLPRLKRSSISITSTVPRGVGFGSSAALCAALSSAVLGRGAEGAWELAHELERAFHGTPSGIDTGLSLLAGVTAFDPQPPALPRWETVQCAPLWLVVGAVPRSENSAALIRGIGERMLSGDSLVRSALSGLGRISAEARKRLTERASASSIAGLADQAQILLRDLDLSSTPLDAVIEAGRNHGALGGKLSGAGGGGAFFLVCDGEPSAQAVAARLMKETRFVAAPRVLCIGENSDA